MNAVYAINPQQSNYMLGQIVTLTCTDPVEPEYSDYENLNCMFGYSINSGNIVWNSEKRKQGRTNLGVVISDSISLPSVDVDSRISFYGVCAGYFSTEGYASSWKTLNTANAEVIYTATLLSPNTAPTISGSDGDLGEKYTSFFQNYTVNDADASNILNVTTKLDNNQINNFTATRNTTYTVDLANYFNSLSLGQHTITISVTDGKLTTSRTYTFTKVNPPNVAPTISGSDSDLGERSDSFTQDYSVNDNNAGDTLTVIEKIDSTVIRSFTATRNTTYTVDLANYFNSLSLGQHTITVSVTDGTLTTTRTYTFNKSSTANHIPTISGANGDLGEKKTTFPIDFSVNDLDVNDNLDITIKLDNTISKLIPSVIRNTTYTYAISSEEFQTLNNGQHSISIIVSDGKANSTRVYTFTKAGQTATSEENEIYEYPSKKLDLKKDKDIYIKCKQLDDIILNFDIYNNSVPINIEEFFIELRGGNSNNLVITSDGITKKDNHVRIECLRAVTSISGEIPIELKFSNANGKQKRTFSVILDVQQSVIDNVANSVIITTLEHLDNSLEEARIINKNFNSNVAIANEMNSKLNEFTADIQNVFDTSIIKAAEVIDNNPKVLEIKESVENIETELFGINGKLSGQVYYTTPKQFGAKGDGINDDTVAFQNAINSASANGVSLFIDKGTYLITNTLIVENPINIQGSSTEYCVILFKEKSFNTETKYGETYWEQSQCAIRILCNNVTVSNMTIQGESKSNKSKFNGITFHRTDTPTQTYKTSERIKLEQVRIKYFNNGIFIYGGWNRYFICLEFIDNSDSGIKYDALELNTVGYWAASGDIIQSCQFTGNTYGYYAMCNFESTVQNCIFEYNKRAIWVSHCKDVRFINCWNEANYNNIYVRNSAVFEGGYNITPSNIDHEVDSSEDIIELTYLNKKVVIQNGKVVYSQINGIVTQGVNLGSNYINKLTNTIFNDLTDWDAQAGVTASNEVKYDSHNVIKYDIENKASDAWIGAGTKNYDSTVNQSYTASLYILTHDRSTIDQGAYLELQYLTSDGYILAKNKLDIKPIANDVWEYKTITASAPENTVYMKLFIYATRNGQFYIANPFLAEAGIDNNNVVFKLGSNNLIQVIDVKGNVIGNLSMTST